ncbi:MAG: hypothetical protein JU82_08980 [Sulfuricurvum sp. MLSB]|uniref:hypothetical protein n=1 Tax=Sulfuricurvum sp. MLSB TaxID=1537917 RepID=UPI00050385DF|nr:hypothetical protein [Sulfuricurvum sp. MLSB]KFN38994.1 MAG: hypothetical protein JU82_08980 [Sulfuricurvum sp. MLSB]
MNVSCALRVRKLRGNEVSIAIAHNARKQSDVGTMAYPKTSDPNRVYLNRGYAGKNFNDITNEKDLLIILRQEFLHAKSNGLLPVNARFPKKNGKYRKKDGTLQEIPTSFMREIILQIGGEGQVTLDDKVYLEIAKFFANLLKNSLVHIDIHRDETSEHMHVLMTHWSFSLNRFHNWFEKTNSFQILQDETNRFVKKLLVPYGLNVIPHNEKAVTGDVHIPHKLYKRFLEPLNHEIENKKKQLEDLENSLFERKKIEEQLKEILNEKLIINKQKLDSNLAKTPFKDSLLAEYAREIQKFNIAAAIAFLETTIENDHVEKELNNGYIQIKR